MRIWTILAFLFTALGVGLILFFAFNEQFNDGSFVINPDLASSFGSFVGGVVSPILSLSVFFLIFETLVLQRKTFQLQKFEGRLFELLKFHRQNVVEMKMRIPSEQNEAYEEGYRCFIIMKKQFDEIYNICNEVIQKEESEIRECDLIKLSYSILFYGVAKKSLVTLKQSVQNIDSEVVNKVIQKCRLKKTKYDQDIVYYGGNQSRLGHYFRNLSHIIQYIDNASFLSGKDKYEYAKMLRIQLSQYELAIFFLNSFSERGASWKKNKWIVNYQLIKNIPENFLGNISPKKYFPFKYEYEE